MSETKNDSKLSSKVTVDDYKTYVRKGDKDNIADFFKQRIKERYIKPFDCKAHKNGFIMMASSCLMIEMLESFYKGKKNTERGDPTFAIFFKRHEQFSAFKETGKDFYENVRCGIMHQGETTGGWHIRRNGKLFDESTKTINATKFLLEMNNVLDEYCNKLLAEDWNSQLWKKFRKKMNFVCKNTERSDA